MLARKFGPDSRPAIMNDQNPNDQNPNDPLHGVTLETILTQLVERYGWDSLGQSIDIRCFNYDPSIKSSLKFLRRTPWARKKVEELYLFTQKNVWQQALPILYSFRRCPYAMRARLALAVSQQRYLLREVDLKDRPQELYDHSPKGTVPVLVLPNGEVLDESFMIMQWALQQRDPESWLPQARDEAAVLALVQRCESEFKFHLDRYKYADRYEGVDALEHRAAASVFLHHLENILSTQTYLSGANLGLADMALAPFVRQFAGADMAWFRAQDWVRLAAWLEEFLASKRFAEIMLKYPAEPQIH